MTTRQATNNLQPRLPGMCAAQARWDGAWQICLSRGGQTASVREGDEAGFLRGGWRVIGWTPLLTTDAEAARAAALGWEISVGTGNFFHQALRIQAHTTAELAARALAAYRRDTGVFDSLNYRAGGAAIRFDGRQTLYLLAPRLHGLLGQASASQQIPKRRVRQ